MEIRTDRPNLTAGSEPDCIIPYNVLRPIWSIRHAWSTLTNSCWLLAVSYSLVLALSIRQCYKWSCPATSVKWRDNEEPPDDHVIVPSSSYWWRLEEYEVVRGTIHPKRGAKLHRPYDAWKAYNDARGKSGRRERGFRTRNYLMLLMPRCESC